MSDSYRYAKPRASVRLIFLSSLILFSVLLVVASHWPLPANTEPTQCGVERWSVKTGTDLDAPLVNLSSATPTAIATMYRWPRPASLPNNNRIWPYEQTLWVVNATLTKYKREDDSDYHLVLTDEDGNTLVTELAWSGCVDSNSPFASAIASARAKFDANLTATTSFKTTSVPVKLSGVGFFDYLHGQTGMAPNGIELHPVLDINFNPAPVLLTEANSERAIALDSVTLMRDPFPVMTTRNFSTDNHTRVMLFAADLILMPGETTSAVSVQGEDAQQRIYPLTVEAVKKIPNFEWLTQINVRLPDELAYVGDVWISIKLRGQVSNKALISIKP